MTNWFSQLKPGQWTRNNRLAVSPSKWGHFLFSFTDQRKRVIRSPQDKTERERKWGSNWCKGLFEAHRGTMVSLASHSSRPQCELLHRHKQHILQASSHPFRPIHRVLWHWCIYDCTWPHHQSALAPGSVFPYFLILSRINVLSKWQMLQKLIYLTLKLEINECLGFNLFHCDIKIFRKRTRTFHLVW